MGTVTVSDEGQVEIPIEIRQRLGITPGCQLDFAVQGETIRVRVRRSVEASRPEDGYGMLVCREPGERRLSEFDVAAAMRRQAADEGA